jgi:hypothetical protein
MTTVVEFIKHRLLASSLVLAASLIGLQVETGPWGDFAISLVLFALVWALARKQ